jgi:hypothetical protein
MLFSPHVQLCHFMSATCQRKTYWGVVFMGLKVSALSEKNTESLNFPEQCDDKEAVPKTMAVF